MGFIEETGAAQHYRDARIAPIYEGTNGIQAIDLVGRKVRLNGGETLRALCADMAVTADRLVATPDLAQTGRRLAAGIAALERATDAIVAADNGTALASATPFLKLAGDVAGGWILGLHALAAGGAADPWLKAKGAMARLYASQVLSQAPGLADGLCEDVGDLEGTPASALVG